MDKLKNLAGGAGGSAGNKEGGASGQNEDYVDKGLDSAEKKFGLPQNRAANEKITDTAREQFEKRSGKDVPDKISN